MYKYDVFNCNLDLTTDDEDINYRFIERFEELFFLTFGIDFAIKHYLAILIKK